RLHEITLARVHVERDRRKWEPPDMAARAADLFEDLLSGGHALPGGHAPGRMTDGRRQRGQVKARFYDLPAGDLVHDPVPIRVLARFDGVAPGAGEAVQFRLAFIRR